MILPMILSDLTWYKQISEQCDELTMRGIDELTTIEEFIKLNVLKPIYFSALCAGRPRASIASRHAAHCIWPSSAVTLDVLHRCGSHSPLVC